MINKLLSELIDIYIRIRWPKIQSTASLVAMAGVGLVSANFLEFAWTFIFDPAGIPRGTNSPAYFGAILVALGLSTLILDTYISRIESNTTKQDKLFFQYVQNELPWHIVDTHLNNLHNLTYRKSHAANLRRVVHFLQDKSYAFTSRELNKSAMELLGATQSLVVFMSYNFTGHEEVITWDHDCGAPFESEAWKRHIDAERELDRLSKNFEEAYKTFSSTGNKAGFIKIDTVYGPNINS